MKMKLNSPARYLFDLYGRKIKDISKGKWQRFCKLEANVMKGIYIICFYFIHLKGKHIIKQFNYNMNNISFLYKGKS